MNPILIELNDAVKKLRKLYVEGSKPLSDGVVRVDLREFQDVTIALQSIYERLVLDDKMRSSK